jgi:hypothetical protein
MAARMAVRMRSRRRRRRRRRRIILVGGAIALGTSAVHKYSKKDVERIEQQTGKPAEELTDEELAQATQQLGIQPEEMSDQEWDQVEASDAEEDAADPDDADPDDAEPAAAAAAEPDYIDQLQRLADLRDKGILTDEEFEAKKKQILDQM